MCSLMLQELCQKIMAGTYNAPEWLSGGAKDLLSRMMTLDPEQRITLEQVSNLLRTQMQGPKVMQIGCSKVKVLTLSLQQSDNLPAI